jgi:SPFH domain/Band 7 family protein
MEAMQLRVAEEYVRQFGKLATDATSTLVVPATLSDVASMITLATNVVRSQSSAVRTQT